MLRRRSYLKKEMLRRRSYLKNPTAYYVKKKKYGWGLYKR
jgi:hypothetical protein